MKPQHLVTSEEYGDFTAFEAGTGATGVYSSNTDLTYEAKTFAEARRMAQALSTEEAAQRS